MTPTQLVNKVGLYLNKVYITKVINKLLKWNHSKNALDNEFQ